LYNTRDSSGGHALGSQNRGADWRRTNGQAGRGVAKNREGEKGTVSFSSKE